MRGEIPMIVLNWKTQKSSLLNLGHAGITGIRARNFKTNQESAKNKKSQNRPLLPHESNQSESGCYFWLLLILACDWVAAFVSIFEAQETFEAKV